MQVVWEVGQVSEREKPGLCRVQVVSGTEPWAAGAPTVSDACVLAAAVFAETGVSLNVFDETGVLVAGIGSREELTP